MNPKALAIAVLVVLAVMLAGIIIETDDVEAASRRWRRSTHADPRSEAFTYWNDEEPPLIPADCAKCHSTYGYLDFLGEDGSPVGSVQQDAQVGTVLYCNVCHNETAHEREEVVFPSGVTITALDESDVCMRCHQGLTSTEDVRRAIEGLAEDTVAEELGFINVHYLIAAATLMGDRTHVAYQYEDQAYYGRFVHVEGLDTCIECHDSHSQEVSPDECKPCHVTVIDRFDLEEIRTSEVDYDGDGNVEEGIAGEIATMQEALYDGMQRYAIEVVGQPIVYNRYVFPFYYVDRDGNRLVSSGEVRNTNQYDAWTPRLLRVAYNYHFLFQDPGSYSHNPYYVLQFLYDSLRDLQEVVEVDMEGMVRPEVSR